MKTARVRLAQRHFARALSALFLLSICITCVAAFTTTANATEGVVENLPIPVIDYKVVDTTGQMPTEKGGPYTVEAGDTITFELDISGVTRPQLVSIISDEWLQFQGIQEITAIDRNNEEVYWNYENTVPVNQQINIDAMGLPDDTYRLNVKYNCTVKQSDALTTTGVTGRAIYVDNGNTYKTSSPDQLYSLNFNMTIVDSSKTENTENFLDAGSYSLYYNSNMTRPVRFVDVGHSYQVVPEWDGRGTDHINIENSGTFNISGLSSGVYYLAQTNAPEEYADNIGVVELELKALQSGSTYSTSVKILNDSDVALYKANLTANANNLSIDYGHQSFMQQVTVAFSKNAIPLIGLMCVGLAAAVIAVRKTGFALSEGE